MPYQIAKEHGVLIVGEPLGDFHGYYSRIAGQKIIHINTRIPTPLQKYAVAFLVYGAITNAEMLYLTKTNQHYGAVEREAARFALEMLGCDLLTDFAKSCKSDKEQIKESLRRVLK